MTARLTFLVIIALSVGASADVRAQHEGHQMPGAVAPAAPAAGCAQGAVKALAIVEAASAQLETAQRATSTTDGDTVSRVQIAVAAAQAELFICRAAVSTVPVAAMPAGAMTGTDHSKMPMSPSPAGGPTPLGAKPAAAMAGMDHSTMDMGKPAAAAVSAAPAAKAADPVAGMDHSKMGMGASPAGRPAPPGAKPAAAMAGMDHSAMGTPTAAAQSAKPAAKAADPMPGMDHSKMKTGGGGTAAPGRASLPAGSAGKLPVAMAERIADPACPGNVGRASAARAVHERKVYYFCSTAARDEFRRDPVGYLKKHPR